MTRFQKFYRNLLKSPSQPIRILAAMLRSDVCSVSGRNLARILEDAGRDPLALSRKALIQRLHKKREIPEGNTWLLEVIEGLLEKFREDVSKEEEEIDKQALYVLCVF